ncbi:hypothetical protein AXF42_Ash009547 [Apostasia shenzhenica]|uniref:Uncharacterized protein n=1 Tax=Apostasia shenzhenica TaxID=1088818 RepID=A0A2I0B962_9ASPA|nr:hypothetical protein AXF42_Ash009547 [Apostasia shenzhenica]
MSLFSSILKLNNGSGGGGNGYKTSNNAFGGHLPTDTRLLRSRSKIWPKSAAPAGNSGRADSPRSPERKTIPKELILRYLSKIKPFYYRFSKVAVCSVKTGPCEPLARLSGEGMRKSKSASDGWAFAASLSPEKARRDDSLLQQEEGIRSAIAHCKQSFRAETESQLFLSIRDNEGELAIADNRSFGI